jgi:hypothetical protein
MVDPDLDPSDPDYEGPEDGPFRCDNCMHFKAPNQCNQLQVVATRNGQVDPAGCCKFFKTLSAGSGNYPNPTNVASNAPSHAGLNAAASRMGIGGA